MKSYSDCDETSNESSSDIYSNDINGDSNGFTEINNITNRLSEVNNQNREFDELSEISNQDDTVIRGFIDDIPSFSNEYDTTSTESIEDEHIYQTVSRNIPDEASEILNRRIQYWFSLIIKEISLLAAYKF